MTVNSLAFVSALASTLPLTLSPGLVMVNWLATGVAPAATVGKLIEEVESDRWLIGVGVGVAVGLGKTSGKLETTVIADGASSPVAAPERVTVGVASPLLPAAYSVIVTALRLAT